LSVIFGISMGDYTPKSGGDHLINFIGGKWMNSFFAGELNGMIILKTIFLGEANNENI